MAVVMAGRRAVKTRTPSGREPEQVGSKIWVIFFDDETGEAMTDSTEHMMTSPYLAVRTFTRLEEVGLTGYSGGG